MKLDLLLNLPIQQVRRILSDLLEGPFPERRMIVRGSNSFKAGTLHGDVWQDGIRVIQVKLNDGGLPHSVLRRYFDGILCEEGEYTRLKGRFKYFRVYKIAFLIWAMLFSIKPIINFLSTSGWDIGFLLKRWMLLAAGVAFLLLICIPDNRLYERETMEKIIEAFDGYIVNE